MPQPTSPTNVTDVDLTDRDKTLLTVVGGVLGAILGALGPWLADRALHLSWVPFGGLLRILRDSPDAWGGAGRWIAIVALALVGVFVGFYLIEQAVKLRVTDSDITVLEGAKQDRFARSQVARVVIEGRWVSLRDSADVDLARRKLDVDMAQARAALVRHSWQVD